MDAIRFLPGQVRMYDRKNPNGDRVIIELSPLWQDGKYHFIVSNLDYPAVPPWYVNKEGKDSNGVLHVAPLEPLVEYKSWAWLRTPDGKEDWYECRRIPGDDTLVQFEFAIPGVMLHNGGGRVPDGRAWWINASAVVDGGDKPLLAKGTTPPATTPVTTPVSTTGWVEEDDDSVGEHTLPPLPAFEAVHVDGFVNVTPAAPTSVLPLDWRDRVWQAYVTTGGEMGKLIQDYKQLYQAE